MKQHKWHKEIKAWADGAEIEKWMLNDTWQTESRPDWHDYGQYRIKPQPKTPKQSWDEELTRSYKETIIERLRNDDKFYDEVFSAYDNAKDNEIKPQPKEPQYLYVYLDDNYEFSTIPLTGEWEYIGKIKLETKDESH